MLLTTEPEPHKNKHTMSLSLLTIPLERDYLAQWTRYDMEPLAIDAWKAPDDDSYLSRTTQCTTLYLCGIATWLFWNDGSIIYTPSEFSPEDGTYYEFRPSVDDPDNETFCFKVWVVNSRRAGRRLIRMPGIYRSIHYHSPGRFEGGADEYIFPAYLTPFEIVFEGKVIEFREDDVDAWFAKLDRAVVEDIKETPCF